MNVGRPTTISKKRHRFQRVGERVANLQTELYLHVKTNAEEIPLSFQEELALQGELTTIESFQQLYRKLQPLCTTTPQLLHHLNKIVKLLKAELMSEPVSDIQRDRMIPVLKLLVALTRELRKEFYPHFAGVLAPIIAVIDTKDPELSAQVFKTITMMFNVLRVHLLKDMDAVHKCYFPLLGHPKPFVRDFAAHTLSMLLRRIDSAKELRAYLSTYLQALSRGSGHDDEILKDGSAKLFFALLKNVNHGFHSRMQEIFVALLGSFRPKIGMDHGDETRMTKTLVYDIVTRTNDLMVRHTDDTNLHEMLFCFQLVLNKVLTRMNMTRENISSYAEYLSQLITMILHVIKYKIGRLISSNERNISSIHELCASLLEHKWILRDTTVEVRSVLLRLFELVWRLFPAPDSVIAHQVNQFFSVAAETTALNEDEVVSYWRTELILWIERSLTHQHVTVAFNQGFVLPNALSLAFNTFLNTRLDAFAFVMDHIGNYMTAHEHEFVSNTMIIHRNGNRFITRENGKTSNKVLLDNIVRTVTIALQQPEDGNQRALAWKLCRALAFVDVDEHARLATVKPLLDQVSTYISGNADAIDIVEWRAIRAELWRLEQIAMHQLCHGNDKLSPVLKGSKTKQLPNSNVPLIWEALRGHEQSYGMLSAFLEFLKMQSPTKQHELLPVSLLKDAEQVLGANLRSPSHALRLVTLEILSRFERMSFLAPSAGNDEHTNGSLLSGSCEILDHSLHAELLCGEVSVQVEREIVRHVSRVQILARSSQTPVLYKQLVIQHLFGLFHVKFSTLWTHVIGAISTTAHSAFAHVWPSICDEVWTTAFRPELASPCTDKESVEVDESIVVRTRRELNKVCAVERGDLDLSVVTDTLTHHRMVWKTLAQCVDQVETKTKFIVPLFLLFIRDQYATIYTDELDEKKRLELEEALEKLSIGTEWSKYYPSHYSMTSTSTKAVRQRMMDYLNLFATFKNMKGVYAQGFLHDFFFDYLLMKSDDQLSKLALQCLFGFEKKHLSAYKDQLNRMADANTFREELTTFHIGENAGVVLKEHRNALLPVLVRLLYSKAISKKGRNAGDTVGSRRAAILSYLAALKSDELVYFVELVVRAFDLKTLHTDGGVDLESPTTQRMVVHAVPQLTNVQSSRILGFLNLLEDLIGQLGIHLAVFIPSLADVLVAMLEANFKETAETLEEDEHDENEEELYDGKASSNRKQIRTLVYRRLAEMLNKFDSRVNLMPWIQRVLVVIQDPIVHLPGAVIGADKASALLELVVAIGEAERARQALTSQHVCSMIQCLSSGLEDDSKRERTTRGIAPEILLSILQFMSALLDGDNEPMLVPHIPMVLAQFVARFQSKAARYAQEHYAGSSKRELEFLCRLSHHVESLNAEDESAQSSASALFQLLLPFLQRNHHSSTIDMTNILQVLAQLVRLLVDPTKYVGSLAKLLAPGPNGLVDREVRTHLINVFNAIGQRSQPIAEVATLLEAMNAYDKKKIEEMDVEKRIDAMTSLSGNDQSHAFANLANDTALLTPVMAQLLQSMHESEYALRSAAQTRVNECIQLTVRSMEETNSSTKTVLLNVLESLIMPCVRYSVKVPREDIRRGFVLLLATIADATVLHSLKYIPRDLVLLRRQDDIEVDFFYNLTHIQVHRKRRALQRLNALMSEMKGSNDKSTIELVEDEEDKEIVHESTLTCFSNATVHHLLLPLILHFIYETQAKSQESLRHEAAQCIGAAAGLLGWSHYLGLLRRLLKSIDGHIEMEQAIIHTICCVIDHYHFTLDTSILSWALVQSATTIQEEDESRYKVQDQMESQVLPLLKKYLFKAVTSKGAHKLNRSTTSFDDAIVSTQHVAVRAPLALAIVKVLRRLRVQTFYLEFPKLLMSMIKLLKSKQEEIRVSVRVTLVKIVEELGTAYLLPIVEELRHTLTDGYMIHVLAYTVHVILEKVHSISHPQQPPSLIQVSSPDPNMFVSDLDACLPGLLAIIVPDLFRTVVENQDGSEHKSKMKEAKSSTKSYDALELLAQSITFLPNPSIHVIVSTIITTFQQQPENAKSIQVVQESMRRIALGLVKNTGIERSYVFLYVYNLLESNLEAIRPMTALEKDKLVNRTNMFTTCPLVSAWQVNEKSETATAQLAQRVNAKEAARLGIQTKMTGFNRHEIDDQERLMSRTHLDEMLTFAVYLLFAFVRDKKTKEDMDTHEVALVDPLVPLLMRCASESKNNRAVMNALKCLSVLLHRDVKDALPSLDMALGPLVDRLFKILQKAGAATRGSEMVQTCYRTLTVIMRQRPQFRITEAQLRVLVSFVRADLDETDHQNATYALLKSIIASRLVINEIYDVVVRVGEILVQSTTETARANCASIYITFLLEYPLGSKRLTQHIHFLLKNLSYTYESGRKAVLETLVALVKKLPLEIVNEKAQFLLLPLVLRVANDESSTCRAIAGDAIRTLVKRMGNHVLNECITLVSQWWIAASQDKKLLSTTAQVTTLMLECRPEFIDKHAIKMLDCAHTEVNKRLQDLSEMDSDQAILTADWSGLVHVMTCIVRFSESLIVQYETWLLKHPEFLKDTLMRLLDYPQTQVRLGALRIIGSYVRRRTVKTLTFNSEKKIKKLTTELTSQAKNFLQSKGMLFLWASRVCTLLEKPQLTVEHTTEILFVLSFLCAALQANPKIPQDVSTVSAPQENVKASEVNVINEDDAEDNEDGESDAVDVVSLIAQQDEQEREQSKTPLGWILTRLSYMARGSAEAVQTTIYQFFALFIHDCDADVVRSFVVQMINPLYRAASVLQAKDTNQSQQTFSGSASKSKAEDVNPCAILAQEVLERLEQKIGPTEFLETFTLVQRRLSIFRAARREKRKRDLMNDPELAARRKLQKNDTKKRAKQLKKRKFAVMKGTVSAATRPTKIQRPGAV